MTEGRVVGSPAASDISDPLEVSVEQAIAVCDGDVRAALRAALLYNEFLERKLDMVRAKISSGYTRGRISAARKASEKVEEWRGIPLVRTRNRAGRDSRLRI